MAVPLAETSDIEAIWRPLTDAETAVAWGQIQFASAIVRRKVPLVDARLAAGSLDWDLVRGVVASMVQRVLLNPERNSEFSVDDVRVKKDASVASGGLYLSGDELILLLPVSTAGSTTGGAFSIRTAAVPFRAGGASGWFEQAAPWVDPLTSQTW